MFPLAGVVEKSAETGCDGSSREPVTALCPTGFKHGPAGSSAHTVAEPVFSGPTAIVWLKGAFHARLLTSRKFVLVRLGVKLCRGQHGKQITQHFSPCGKPANFALPIDVLIDFPQRANKLGKLSFEFNDCDRKDN